MMLLALACRSSDPPTDTGLVVADASHSRDRGVWTGLLSPGEREDEGDQGEGMGDLSPEFLPDTFLLRSRLSVESGVVSAGRVEAEFQDVDGASCLWVGRAIDVGPGDLGEYVSRRVQLRTFESDCSGFDPAVWEDGQPSDALERIEIEVGYAPLSEGLENQLAEEFDNWGFWQRFAFATWFRFTDPSGSVVTAEAGWTVAHGEDGLIEFQMDTEGPGDGRYVTSETLGFFAFTLH